LKDRKISQPQKFCRNLFSWKEREGQGKEGMKERLKKEKSTF